MVNYFGGIKDFDAHLSPLADYDGVGRQTCSDEEG